MTVPAVPGERSELVDRMAWLSRAAGLTVTAIGALVLAGWVFDVHALKTIYGPITMKANGAVAFALCGISLWLLHVRPGAVSIACAALAGLIGALTLSQHAFGWNLGIDELLFRELPGAAATASPNRMGPNAATSFALASLSLLLLHRPQPRAIAVGQALSFAGVVLAMLPAIGYAYGAETLYGIAAYTSIALHTAVTLIVLHLGILAARCAHGPMALFASAGAAGMLLRRLSVWVVVLPLLLGHLLVIVRETALVDRGLGTALFTVSMIVLLLATVWHTAGVIDVSERERRRAQEEAHLANRLKDQFIAMLSHELRTPLNVMLGRLTLLEAGPDEATRARATAIVARNGRLLARLVEDLLDLSRAASGQFEISPALVDVNAVVRTMIDGVSAEAVAKGVQVTGSFDADAGEVFADPQRLQQVVSNLLVNALKFTGPGGRVDVRTARGAGGVTIAVSDTGIGFDEQFATRLFQPFQQADASSRREHGGLGLGLAIAKHLVELHGGTIAASSAGPGRGATFMVTFPPADAAPRRQPPSRAAQPSPSSGPAASAPHVA